MPNRFSVPNMLEGGGKFVRDGWGVVHCPTEPIRTNLHLVVKANG